MPIENGAGQATTNSGSDFDAFLKSNPGLLGGGFSSASSEPMVFMGTTTPSRGAAFHDILPSDSQLGLSEAKLDIYGWSEEEQAQWGKRLYNAGLIKDPNNWDAMVQAWQYAVGQAGSFYSKGKKITPWQVVDLMSKGGGGDAGPRTTHSTSTSTNMPARSDVEATVKSMFKNMMGRDPEEGELDRYVSQAMAGYKKNPSVTNTTATTDANGNTNSNSTSSGGFNPQGVLEDSIQGDPEWGAFQAATTYFNALQGALGAPGGSAVPG